MTGSASLAIRMAGVIAAVAAVGGCGSSGGASSAPTASTAAPAASETASAAPVPASGASSAAAVPSASVSPRAVVTSPATPGAAAACATRDLQAKVGVTQGAAGSTYQVIDFTNIGTAPCTLSGYPGVSLASGTPVTQVGAAASRSTSAAPTVVTLSPGRTANALLRIVQALNYPTATCSPMATTYLQIYPPDQTTPIYLAYKSTGCTSNSVNLLTIGVVQAGSGSSGQ